MSLVNGNLLEYNWPQAQNGFAILFTVRNQDGAAPWSTIEDVAFTNNLVRHVAAGVNMLGRDDNNPSQQARRIAIRNNVFLDVGGSVGQRAAVPAARRRERRVTIDHNTAFQTGGVLFGGDHAPHTGFVFQNNVVMLAENGVIGSSAGEGMRHAEALLSRLGVPPQRDRRRHGRPVSGRQLLPRIAAGRGADDSARPEISG